MRGLVALLVLGLAACAGNGSSPSGGSGGVRGSGGVGASSGGSMGSGGSNGSGGAGGSGGSTTGSGGASGTGGTGAPSGGSKGSSDSGGAGGAGASTGGGAAGATGGGAGGATGGRGGNGNGGGAGGGPPSGGACSRDLLKSIVEAYFKALAAHSPAGLPIADPVKATENGKAIKVGEDGLWKTAGMLRYKHSAYDVEGCNAASEAVVGEGSVDLPVALRLKVVEQRITEIETIAVRAGDYKVSGSNYPSKPEAIGMSDASVGWEKPVPEAMRNTSKELNAWMLKYFKAFPAGVCNTVSNCQRLENGNSPGACSLGGSCQTADPTGTVIKSHSIFSDVETGVGVGFDLFMGNADMHMFKMYGGKVYAVHAILGAASSTGWDDR